MIRSLLVLAALLTIGCVLHPEPEPEAGPVYHVDCRGQSGFQPAPVPEGTVFDTSITCRVGE